MRYSTAILLTFSIGTGLAADGLPAIALSGAPNFRDLGGYRAADGRMVRYRMVYRSGQLSDLTEADYQKLALAHVRHVFDLRTDSERKAAPTMWKGDAPAFTVVPAEFGPNDKSAILQKLADPAFTAADARNLMKDGMAGLPVKAASGLSAWVDALLAGESPSIVHCSAGKDRTGFFSAMLLTMLGVDPETVMADYLKSNEVMAANQSSAAKGMPPGMKLPAMSRETIGALMRVEAEYLQASFRTIEEKYGSFDRYRREVLQIDDQKLQRLRDLLLTESPK